jgi:hypothetical protein
MDFAPLDFGKPGQEMRNHSLAAPLLKACIVRLTRARAAQIGRFHLESMMGNVLQIKSDVYALKLMNILATDAPGRQYLYGAKDVTKRPITILKAAPAHVDRDGLYISAELYGFELPDADKAYLQRTVTMVLRSLFPLELRLRRLDRPAGLREAALMTVAEAVVSVIEAIESTRWEPDTNDTFTISEEIGGERDFDIEEEALLAKRMRSHPTRGSRKASERPKPTQEEATPQRILGRRGIRRSSGEVTPGDRRLQRRKRTKAVPWVDSAIVHRT